MSLELDEATTVGELKQLIGAQASVDPSCVRLLRAEIILRRDAQTLSASGVRTGETLRMRLVRPPAAAETATNAAGAASSTSAAVTPVGAVKPGAASAVDGAETASGETGALVLLVRCGLSKTGRSFRLEGLSPDLDLKELRKQISRLQISLDAFTEKQLAAEAAGEKKEKKAKPAKEGKKGKKGKGAAEPEEFDPTPCVPVDKVTLLAVAPRDPESDLAARDGGDVDGSGGGGGGGGGGGVSYPQALVHLRDGRRLREYGLVDEGVVFVVFDG